MAKKRKKQETMTSVAMTGTMGMTSIGLMPNITGSAAVTSMKTGAAQGISNVGRQLPMMGKLKGASMVMKSTRSLTKAQKKLTRRKK